MRGRTPRDPLYDSQKKVEKEVENDDGEKEQNKLKDREMHKRWHVAAEMTEAGFSKCCPARKCSGHPPL